jgi:hypothetical protein
MSERPEDRELTALESALRDLRPKPEAIDRAMLMYRAGRASARGWAWPSATAFSTLVAITLGMAWWLRPEPAVVERIVYVATPTRQPNDATPAREDQDHPSPELTPDEGSRGAWSRYVYLQEQLLNRGLEGLPSPSASPEEPLNLESLLQPY